MSCNASKDLLTSFKVQTLGFIWTRYEPISPKAAGLNTVFDIQGLAPEMEGILFQTFARTFRDLDRFLFLKGLLKQILKNVLF